MKIQSVQFLLSAFSVDDLPGDGRPEVAFVGRSNVGKSSLLNALLGRKAVARVSSTPGRTRAVNYFLINSKIYFVDLPGYGWARAGKDERRRWADLAGLYFESAANRVEVVQLIDSKVGATELDIQAQEYLRSFGIPVKVAVTKIDRLSRGRRPRQLEAIRNALGMAPHQTITPCSARSGEGIKELWREIDSRLQATA